MYAKYKILIQLFFTNPIYENLQIILQEENYWDWVLQRIIIYPQSL